MNMPALGTAQISGTKVCSECGMEKDIDEFYIRNKNKPYRHSKCKVCVRARVKSQRDPIRAMDKWYRWKYGITLQEYNEMSTLQNHQCSICGKKMDVDGTQDKRLHVDHCHDTGKVRGLICKCCNVGLGEMKHDPQILLSAVEYLKGP